MAILVKILQNSEQNACIKIKSDSSGGSVTITKDMLCYRPKMYTCTPSTDAKDRFQDYDEKTEFTIRVMQWSGYTQENSRGRIYRTATQDLEHQITCFCVGDTCQYEFMGQEMAPECEYSNEDMTVILEGEMTVWIKLRKTGFIHYSGEYADYGQYEDESKLGPKDEYMDQLEQVFGK